MAHAQHKEILMTDAVIIKALKDMLYIAKLAMPDTYYATDSRVKRATKLLKRLEARHAHSDS